MFSTHLPRTPGETLEYLMAHFGWNEVTVEPITDGHIPYDGHDLGNGNYVHGCVSDYHDGCVSGYEGEPIDLSGTSYSDFDNLSARFTGQHGRPNSMHDSEYVGGGLADFIAATPGEWCLPYIQWECSPESCDECDGDGISADGTYCERDIEGWLVLHRDIGDVVA